MGGLRVLFVSSEIFLRQTMVGRMWLRLYLPASPDEVLICILCRQPIRKRWNIRKINSRGR
jgi:hypothetical protein